MKKHTTWVIPLGLILLIAAWFWLAQANTEPDTAASSAVALPAVTRPQPPPEKEATSPLANTGGEQSRTITVSGIVTGPNGPVSDVWIGLGSPQDWQETHTAADGSYTLAIETEGQLWFHLRPDPATRLSQVNRWLDGVTGSFTQNFALVPGYLFDLQLTTGGMPVTYPLPLELHPLLSPFQEGWWYDLGFDEQTGRYQAILPPDVYYVTVRQAPAGYYQTTQPFDLRTSDLRADLPLSARYVHPIPYDPPDAAQITVGPPDDLGEATVTGGPGAALPLARVLLVNLNSAHQAHTTSQADGSFSARIYAPPGSAVMVKHGPASHRWGALEMGLAEGVNPFPGTIINLPHTHSGAQHELPFAAAGAVQLAIDDPAETRNYVGAAWALTGTVGPVPSGGGWTRVLTGSYDGQVVPGLYLGGLNWTHPALGDLDGDGDQELLVGEQFGQLVLYRNQGSPAEPDWRFETIGYAGVDNEGWAYPALADVTGDGALDLFVGSGAGALDVYYNAGTPQAPAWPPAPDVSLTVGGPASPALDDLDGDGDLDLLAGRGEAGGLTHYENTGAPDNPVWTWRGDSYQDISEPGGLQPAFLDLDGDGDRDLLLGLCGQLIWYQRGGTAQTPTWTRVGDDPVGYGGGSCGTSPGVGDWDGDGDDDLVIGEHWGGLRFFRNDGPPNWAEEAYPFPFELAGDSAPALTDWDNDGDPDLLLGQAHGQVHQYTNVGSPTAPDWRPDGLLLELPWTDHPHPYPAFADVDGDDDPDLVVGEGSWEGPGAGGGLRYYENVGTPETPNWTLVSDHWLDLDVGGWSTPAFADVDADGDSDLFVGDEAGTLTFVENTGTPTAPAWAAPVHPYADLSLDPFSAPAFFDLDQDGDLDMLIGSENGSLAYVQNVGTATSPGWELVSTLHSQIDVGERSIPAAADADGDGQPDLFLGDGDGGLNLYRYAGPGAPPAAASAYAPGDQLRIQGKLRLYGPAITATTDLEAISVHGWPGLLALHDQAGRPLAASNYFMSTLLTPTGLPIQGNERPGGEIHGAVQVEDWQYLGGHTLQASFSLDAQLADDLLPGIYRPHIWFDFAGVPTNTQWLAANVTGFSFGPQEAVLPPIHVRPGGTLSLTHPPRLTWRLLMDDVVAGTRGTGARQDRGSFELASQIVSQGAPYYTPPVDVRSGQPITYRLEPFLPMISFTDRRMPGPPLIPFDLPGGQLQVALRQPDGSVRDLGSEPFAQSFNRTPTTRAGADLNPGTTQLDDVYSLQAGSDRFRLAFEQYGHYTITMTGVVSDLWGNPYQGGGTYDLWVAQQLDVDPGLLPGTPLAVGDAFNPALQVYPRLPAQVTLTLTLYPDSDPAQAITHTLTGQANPYGYFSSPTPFSLTHPGEYRVDLVARHTDPDGVLYMAALTWGGIVMTPDAQADLVAHGRRGLDSLEYIPNHWFISGRDLSIPEGAISHSYNPYYNGDILWSRLGDDAYGGDALLAGGSVQDTVGVIQAAIRSRFERKGWVDMAPPGDFEERVAAGELPLFLSTLSGRPPQLLLRQIGKTIPADVDQIAYAYRSSQRPGSRVREVVSEDGQNGGYWRLDTLYDDQLGVGVLGDQPNDFKFQYVGAVYRDLQSGHNEYVGQGTGWVYIPDEDPLGSRVMPPFAGPGNGGWTTEGGPILTLKGEDVHIFILPTGVRPGAVLEVGDSFHFGGPIMPTLDSQVALTVTAPSGSQHYGGGRANRVGYFYDPADDFVVDEPGLWSVDVRVWHDGLCSGGQTVPPYPSGDVLGSEDGRYWFYVVPEEGPRLDVSAPEPGFLVFEDQVSPITIGGSLPPGLSGATIDYTISMPGYILAQGQITPTGDSYQISFDPVSLQQDFANLDLVGRDDGQPGLSDTFAIGLLLQGERGGQTVYYANSLTLQGERVYVGPAQAKEKAEIYLPVVMKGS